MTLRVIVADDQDLVRTGLAMILNAQPGIEVVGEASDGAEAVHLARHLRPDVCLLDINMPRLDGIEATKALAGPDAADPIPVVIITTFDRDEYVYGALKAGARGSCSRTPTRNSSSRRSRPRPPATPSSHPASPPGSSKPSPRPTPPPLRSSPSIHSRNARKRSCERSPGARRTPRSPRTSSSATARSRRTSRG